MMKIRAFRKGDEEVYVKVYNEAYSTEDWYGTLAKALTIEDLSKLDYDATYFAQVENKVIGLVDIKIRDELADIETVQTMHRCTCPSLALQFPRSLNHCMALSEKIGCGLQDPILYLHFRFVPY